MRRNLCVASWPSTKHGSTGAHQRPINSRNSGLHPANLLRRGRRLSHRPDRPPLLGFTRSDLHRLFGKGKTVTGLYYSELFGRFAAELQRIRPHLAKNKVLFHHDNAPAHTSALAKAKLVELGYELLRHPPYSPDLAPCDFFLIPNLKKSLPGQKFASNEEVVAAT